MRTALINLGWWIFNNIHLGPLTPYWFGMMIGRWPHKVKEDGNNISKR